eukprot:3230703-Pleurochrysis_carterae.AAC.2
MVSSLYCPGAGAGFGSGDARGGGPPVARCEVRAPRSELYASHERARAMRGGQVGVVAACDGWGEGGGGSAQAK